MWKMVCLVVWSQSKLPYFAIVSRNFQFFTVSRNVLQNVSRNVSRNVSQNGCETSEKFRELAPRLACFAVSRNSIKPFRQKPYPCPSPYQCSCPYPCQCLSPWVYFCVHIRIHIHVFIHVMAMLLSVPEHEHEGDTLRGNTSATIYNFVFVPSCIFSSRRSDLSLNWTTYVVFL
jgi:hypothetical protein